MVLRTGIIKIQYSAIYSTKKVLSCFTMKGGACRCLPEPKRTVECIMYGHTYSKSMNQPGKVANPARSQLNRENGYFPVPVRA